MKNILVTAILTTMLGITACDEGDFSSWDGDGKTTIRIHDETGTLRLESRGTITFNDDETELKSISADGYVRFKKNGNKIFAETNGAGEIVYTVNDGAPTKALNDGDKKLLARAIKEMINVGFDAKNRVARIYNKNGVNGVITAIQDIRNDWVKSNYYEYVIVDNKITNDEMVTVVRSIGEDVSSDYEKAKLLKKVPASYLDYDRVTEAYLQAANTLSSDYEKSGALQYIIDEPLTPAQYTQVLAVTGNITSDYEKAQVLKKLIAHGTPGEKNMNEFLAAAQGVNSDYERGEILKEVLRHGTPAGSSFTKFLDVTSDIGGDYEKGEVIKQTAKANITDENQWISLIKETEKLNSDNDKSNAMIEIAKRMPKTERVRDAYMLSAKAITADYDYGQAVKAAN